MQDAVLWVKKHSKIFKNIFLMAVVVIVSRELLSIGKTISMEQLKESFKEIAPYKMGIMALVGIVAVLPMTGYDFILNKMLKLDHKIGYILETSWLVNTINNLAGFGGLVSIGLRSEFYTKDREGKEVLGALSKILLFLEAGLSLFGLISFFMVLTDKASPFVQQYWPWLIGGGLYFPVVYLVTFLKKKGILGGLTPKYRLALTATSFLEWLGVVVTFCVIGWLMGIEVSLWDLVPLFIASSIIGIVSMIPGALGSFDVMMILGLTSLGVPRADVVVWLLFFRLFYYLVPFVIGLVLFFKNIWSQVNDRYSGIPRNLTLEVFHKVEVFLMYFSGIMIVLLATIPQGFTEIQWLKSLNIFHYHLVAQFPNIILGFSLLIMGRGIAAQVKRAYFPTIFLLVVAIVYTIFFSSSIFASAVLGIILIMIIFSRSELYREQLVYSWQWMTVDGLIIGALAILYVAIGVYNSPVFPHHHRGPQLSFMVFPSERLWLFGLLGIFVIAFFMLLFLRYLEGKKQEIGTDLEEARVLHILETYGGNITSQLAFLGDKSIYIYNDGAEDTVFLQFVTYNNKCVVMGDPSGKESDFKAALEQFINEADVWCYQAIFYECDAKSVTVLHELGYDFIKMGEEAYVDLENFTTSGKKMKGTRSVVNKISREGYRFDVLQPPFDAATMASLKEISDSWLKGRKEKGFSMGFFSESYLQRGPIAVVFNQEDEIVSFANLMPTYSKDVGTIDLMRHHSEKAPSGCMDFLFINLFDYLKEAGVRYFDLGMAPLANVGHSRKSFTQERIANLVYEFGSHFYSFQGLREYKEKYASKWVPRYTLYHRDSWIAYVMIAILLVDNQSVTISEKRGKVS